MRPRLPRTTLLLKMLACVALVVAGLPVWAAVCRPAVSPRSGPAVATSAGSVGSGHSASSECAMPCCAPEPPTVASVASCCLSEAVPNLSPEHGTSHLSSVPSIASHGCVLDTVEFGVPAVLAVNPTLVAEIPAILPVASDSPALPTTASLARLRVGIVGTDAGPPPDAPAGPESGRSPPSARR